MTEPDKLLDAFDQLTNTLSTMSGQVGVTITQALAEAIDDWLGEHAAEHHHSEPFTETIEDEEPLTGALRQLLAAVNQLDHPTRRPGVTTAIALTEAIAEWNATASAEFNRSNRSNRGGGELRVQSASNELHHPRKSTDAVGRENVIEPAVSDSPATSEVACLLDVPKRHLGDAHVVAKR